MGWVDRTKQETAPMDPHCVKKKDFILNGVPAALWTAMRSGVNRFESCVREFTFTLIDS